MSRAPGVRVPLILPAPPERYDVMDQRETRRLIVQANQQLPDWSTVTRTPTTLAGYGVADAYTKSAVDALFAALHTRTDLVITTGSLADLVSEASVFAMPAHKQTLLLLQADRACWVRFYATAAAQAADAARGFTTVGTAGLGLLGDFRFTGAATIPVSPVAVLANEEKPEQSRIWYTIQNRSGSTSPVTVTLTIEP